MNTDTFSCSPYIASVSVCFSLYHPLPLSLHLSLFLSLYSHPFFSLFFILYLTSPCSSFRFTFAPLIFVLYFCKALPYWTTGNCEPATELWNRMQVKCFCYKNMWTSQLVSLFSSTSCRLSFLSRWHACSWIAPSLHSQRSQEPTPYSMSNVPIRTDKLCTTLRQETQILWQLASVLDLKGFPHDDCTVCVLCSVCSLCLIIHLFFCLFSLCFISGCGSHPLICVWLFAGTRLTCLHVYCLCLLLDVLSFLASRL